MSSTEISPKQNSTHVKNSSHPIKDGVSITRERGVNRVLQILEYIHRLGRPLRAGEIASGLNAPRSSIYDFTKMLETAGILESRADGSIFFGPTVYFYGNDYLREHDIMQKGRDEVDRLARETGEMCQLCMLHNGKFSVIHMRYGMRSFNITSGIGIEIPVPWTASGRLFFGGMKDDDIKKSLSEDDLLLPNGLSIPINEFIESVRTAEKQGYYITSGLVDVYTHCIAAPIRDSTGKIIATICSVVLIDTPESRIQELCEIMVRSGKSLSLFRLNHIDQAKTLRAN